MAPKQLRPPSSRSADDRPSSSRVVAAGLIDPIATGNCNLTFPRQKDGSSIGRPGWSIFLVRQPSPRPRAGPEGQPVPQAERQAVKPPGASVGSS